MGRKREWVYKGGTSNRYLEIGETYRFNPRFQPDGTVVCKIKGDNGSQKLNLGYRDEASFRSSWKEL